PRFVTSCLLGEPLRVHGDGSAQRDWIYVGDTCEAIDRIAHCDPKLVTGEVINIGTGVILSIEEIRNRAIAHMLPPEHLLTSDGERRGQVVRHTADWSKAKRLLGWEPTVTFADGLAKTAEWYCRQRQIWEKQLWMREIPIVTRAGKQELH